MLKIFMVALLVIGLLPGMSQMAAAQIPPDNPDGLLNELEEEGIFSELL